MRIANILLFFLLTGLTLNAAALERLPEAGQPFTVDSGFSGSAPLGQYLELFEDPSGGMGIGTVALQQGFAAHEKDEPNFGTTASAWWVRLTLVNSENTPRRLILQQRYALIDHFDLWEQHAGEWGERRSGDMLPFDQREVTTNALAYVIELQPQGRHTLFLRYRTNGSMSINLSLHEPVAYAEQLGRQQLVQGVLFGALLALAIYNLFIFFIVRDRSYLLYIGYLTIFSLFIAGFSGQAAHYLWPDSPQWANQSLLIFWGGVIAMALIFSQNFLSLKRYSPRINRAANLFSGIALGCSLASLLLPYALVVKVLFLLAPPAYVLILFGAYQGIRRGYAPASYFMTAWSLLLLAAIAVTLINAGVIREHAGESPLILQVAAMAEMILLSIALASRIRNLEKATLTDALTHTLNRRFFDIQLPRLLAQSQRGKSPLALMIVDIDLFKQFNDTHGHARGDAALKRVAEILLANSRSSDYVCRYGGEEFSVLLPDTHQEKAGAIAERMRTRIMEETAGDMGLSVSIGVACNRNNYQLNEEQLFGAADIALYRAKEQGRNRVELFGEITDA